MKKQTVCEYLAIQKQHPCCIVLFRRGDFYECFGDQAKTVSECCDFVLCNIPVDDNGEDAGKICHTGFPYHSLARYVPLLLENDHVVVIVKPGKLL